MLSNAIFFYIFPWCNQLNQQKDTDIYLTCDHNIFLILVTLKWPNVSFNTPRLLLINQTFTKTSLEKYSASFVKQFYKINYLCQLFFWIYLLEEWLLQGNEKVLCLVDYLPHVKIASGLVVMIKDQWKFC